MRTSLRSPFAADLRFKVLLCHKRAHRAGLDALAAEDAVRILESPVSLGHDLGMLAAVSEADGVVHLDLVARLNASAAENASGKVPDNERVHVLNGMAGIVWEKPVRF